VGARALAVVGMAFCFITATSSPAALLWSEDFENDTVGADPDDPPWNALQEPADSTIDITSGLPWPNSTQVGHVADTATNNVAVFFRTTSIPGVDTNLLTVSFDAYLDYSTKNPGYILLDLLDADGAPPYRAVRSVAMHSASSFLLRNWHHFDLVVNFTGSDTNYKGHTLTNACFDLWQDGELVNDNGATTPADYADGIDGLAFLSWPTQKTKFMFDNIEIRDTPYVYDGSLGNSMADEDEIDDDFDDGDLRDNPGGPGHGFLQMEQSLGSFVEDAGESAVRFEPVTGNYTKRTVAGRDEFLLENWTRHFAWYTDNITVTNGATNIDARILFSVVSDDVSQTSTVGVEPWSTGEGGFWVQVDITDQGTSNSVTCYLYAADDSNVRSNSSNVARLGNFTFTQDDGQPMDAFLSLKRVSPSSQAYDYNLLVRNNTGDVGFLSGTTDAGVPETDLLADELAGGAFVAFSANNRRSGMIGIDLERITVSGKPPEGAVFLIQ